MPIWIFTNTSKSRARRPGRILILTGPHQGGKSVLLEAVGGLISNVSFEVALASTIGSICPVYGIFTHFKNSEDERGPDILVRNAKKLQKFETHKRPFSFCVTRLFRE